jgi:hypothetical protein
MARNVPVSEEDLRRVVDGRAAQRHWVQSPASWAESGKALLQLAEKGGGNLDRNVHAEGRRHLRESLARSPSLPAIWGLLARSEFMVEDKASDAVLKALVNSILTGPHRLDLTVMRIYIGLRSWAMLAPNDRNLLARQAIYAWSVDRGGLARLGAKSGRAGFIRQLLLRAPAILAGFEQRLAADRKEKARVKPR